MYQFIKTKARDSIPTYNAAAEINALLEPLPITVDTKYPLKVISYIKKYGLNAPIKVIAAQNVP